MYLNGLVRQRITDNSTTVFKFSRKIKQRMLRDISKNLRTEISLKCFHYLINIGYLLKHSSGSNL